MLILIWLIYLITVIFIGHLYVANVGDCRALLGQMDADGVLRVMQLTVDHDLTNEDELLRLSHTGLEVEKLKSTYFSQYSAILIHCSV